jgi:hypothetical protein
VQTRRIGRGALTDGGARTLRCIVSQRGTRRIFLRHPAAEESQQETQSRKSGLRRDISISVETPEHD